MSNRQILLAAAIPAALLLVLSIYLAYDARQKGELYEAKKSALTERLSAVEAEKMELQLVLDETTDSRNALLEQLEEERAKTGAFEKTLSGLKETVGTLEKLQFTDPELLAKYSKVFFLSEHYEPTDLGVIPEEYTIAGDRTYTFHARALPYLLRMIRAAEDDGVDLRIASAYRSFGTQTALKSAYTVSYGSGANRFSADQGYSEHQLGTTVDISTKELGAGFTNIQGTPAYTWLIHNAHTYGFVLSYPESNSYYVFEPWHWRFVGTELAKKLHADGQYLYELDQRTLDQYLVSIFD